MRRSDYGLGRNQDLFKQKRHYTSTTAGLIFWSLSAFIGIIVLLTIVCAKGA